MESNRIVLEAIALRRCLLATYNKLKFKLAPHILYTRHDELYVDAVPLERDGRPPRETKIATFKLSGLKDMAVTEIPFRPESEFNPDDPRYRDVTVFTL